MMTLAQLQRYARQAGLQDIGNVETEVVLTHLLELLRDRRLADVLAFKGGTFLRKDDLQRRPTLDRS